VRLTATLLLLAALLLASAPRARAYTLQFTNTSASTQIRWPSTTINIALSTSLNSPPGFVHASGADVVLAARRALVRWSLASNILFNVTTSGAQDAVADGVTLITVADTATNRSLFNTGLRPGRARVTFDPSTGFMTEADLALNPLVTRLDQFGNQVQSAFSTNGETGTYDLESTFVHEIGHMLGLEHSGVLSASMQPRQGVNGTFNLPNFTARSLSSDDIAGIRAIYGPRTGLGSIAGFVTSGSAALFGAHVFAEEVSTGRLHAGNISLLSGQYRIENLPPGQYRVIAERMDEPVSEREIPSSGGAYGALQSGSVPPFVTVEAGIVNVAVDATTTLNFSVQGGTPPFNPTLIGVNGQLSTVAAPIVPGRTTNVLIAGDNLSLVPAGGITVNSPFLTVSNVQQVVGFGIPVISFDLTASVVTPPGDYSVRLQSSSGQIAYISGGLTVDLPSGVTAGQPNLLDNTQFFVAQHYRDFFGREPDAPGLAHWTNVIESCGADQQCREVTRINVSAAFFLSIEFQETGYLVYRAYKAAFGNLPGRPVPVRFQQLFPDTQRIGRGVVVNQGDWQNQLEANKRAYFLEFVQRGEFLAAYPVTMSAAQFVDKMNANAGGPLDAAERQSIINELAAGPGDPQRRAVALRRIAEDATLVEAEKNRAFVLLQYLGYLRRNPDDPPEANLDFAGYNFWLGNLERFNGNFLQAELVKAFITSTEYRRRFAP